MESMIKQIDELCEHLNKAIDAYYNKNAEIMSNKEFDDAMQYLSELEKIENYHPSNSPIGKVGAKVNITSSGRQEVIHEIKARSLDKTKNPEDILSKLADLNSDLAVCMWKLDGCTLVLTYVDGDLVLAATRGDGETGQDVTANAKYIEGIPQRINMNNGKLIVRGECVMSYTDFETINNSLPAGVKHYADPRNLASASVTILNPEDMKNRCLHFKAFDLIGEPIVDEIFDDPDSLVDQFGYLSENGFGVVQHAIFRLDNVNQVIEDFTKAAAEYEYPVDGLVFALDNRKLTRNLPGTEHHPDPKYGYAFKWADEEVETTLREIEWSPSRTGLLNPVAIFDPVQIAGTTVSRASLHNISYIEDKFLNIDDRITVIKANLIIPQIIHNLSLDERLLDERLDNIHDMIPKHCPTCTAPTAVKKEGAAKMLYCTNLECPEKLVGNLAHFCSRDGLDIDGWSEETIKKLIKLNIVREYADIFKLDAHPALAFVPGFGKRSWEKLCKSAEEARHTTFVKFVSALSIPNIGKGQAKVLKKYIDEHLAEAYAETGDYDYNPFLILLSLAASRWDFTVIPGFGDKLAESLFQWAEYVYSPEGEHIHRLLECIVFTDKVPVSKDFMNPPQGILAGKSFCITGKLIHHANRQELVAKIETNGGKWVDSVSSKTDYLINNDVASTSGKNKKAHELNIPIISEEDFLTMLA